MSTLGPYEIKILGTSYSTTCTEQYCQTCGSSQTIQCTKCTDGYRLKDTSETSATTVCVACPSSCKTCTFASPVTCQDCMSGYYLTDTFTCISCSSSGDFRTKSSDNVNLCKTPGLSNCVVYASETECLRCSISADTTYYVDRVSDGDTYGKCVTCDVTSGYFIHDGGCYKCDSNCNICAGKDTCLKCNNNFFLTKSGKCVACFSACKKCDDESKCIECIDGSYLKMPNGEACDLCTGDGVTKEDSTIKKCWSCEDNCKVCSSSDLSICTTCNDGYYKRGGICLPCAEFCATCSELHSCTSCTNGYYLLTETVSGNERKRCDDCSKKGYFINSLNCVACPKNCVTCSGLSVCTQLKEGSFGVGDGDVCSIDNCAVCTQANDCTTCKANYFRKETDDVVSCVKYCDTDGYYQNFDEKSCRQCDAKCKICSSASLCLSCLPGFALSSGVCTSCGVTDCAQCSVVGKCDTCNTGVPQLPGKTSCIACPDLETRMVSNQYLPADGNFIFIALVKKNSVSLSIINF